MNTERTDAEILAGSKVITKFNGKSYAWIQKPRREQRQIRTQIMDIAGMIFTIEGMGDVDKAMFSLKAVNAILEFCEDNNPDMLADIDEIETYIKTSGANSFVELLNDVYMVLYQEWLDPWLTGDTETKKKNLIETSMENQSSMK